MRSNPSLLLLVRNLHERGEGRPPRLEAGPERFVSYFETATHEQAVFVRSGTDTPLVYLGTEGWSPPLPVQEGTIACPRLTGGQYAWIVACWAECVGISFDEAFRRAVRASQAYLTTLQPRRSEAGEPDPCR